MRLIVQYLIVVLLIAATIVTLFFAMPGLGLIIIFVSFIVSGLSLYFNRYRYKKRYYKGIVGDAINGHYERPDKLKTTGQDTISLDSEMVDVDSEMTNVLKWMTIISDLVNDLKANARLNLKYDRSMKQGKTYRVEASIFNDAEKALKSEFTESYEIRASPVMKVELWGKDFDIQPVYKNEQQFIGNDAPSTWRWDVKPLKFGTRILEVTASVCIPIPEYGNQYRSFNTLREEIKVEVNVPMIMKDSIIENWKWVTAVSTLTALVLSYLNYIGFFSQDK